MTILPAPRARRVATLPPIPADYARLEQLYEIQSVLARSVDIPRACEELLPVMTRALSIRSVVLVDVTQELARTLTWAAEGLSAAEIVQAQGHARTALLYLAPALVTSAHEASHAGVLEGGVSTPGTPRRNFVTLPCSLVRDQVFGVFQIEGANTFDEHDLLFINAVAGQLAVRLDRHHAKLLLGTALAEGERANRQLSDLQVISKAALESSELEVVLPAVLAALRTVFACDAASVLLASEDGQTLERHTNVGAPPAGESTIVVGTGVLGTMAAGRSAMRIDDLLEDAHPPSEATHAGMRSLLGAQLRVRQRLTGLVYIASRSPHAFTHENLRLLELIASRIATAIENVSLYERALAAIRSRDLVMGMVSHDLRSPLGTIQLATDILGDAPGIAKPVSIIRRAVGMMQRLIDDMRDIHSIEVGHLSVNRQPEDALSIVGDAVEGIQHVVMEHRLRLEVRPPTRALVVSCDRQRVAQVMTNLLTNAIKFTPQHGSIAVSIDEADGYVAVSVADTGCGIPERDLGHVFDRYWQAAGTARLGTGLGLAIAKGIVDAHGGILSVTSRVGRGTTFSFTLPLAGV